MSFRYLLSLPVLACIMLFPVSAQAIPIASCPVMRDEQVAVHVVVQRAPPSFYDGEGWRVQSEADAKVKASNIAGLDCYYIVAATVTITMSGITTSSFVPAQTQPDIERIRNYVASLIHRRNGKAMMGSESDSWQLAALNDINRVTHRAISELKN